MKILYGGHEFDLADEVNEGCTLLDKDVDPIQRRGPLPDSISLPRHKECFVDRLSREDIKCAVDEMAFGEQE